MGLMQTDLIFFKTIMIVEGAIVGGVLSVLYRVEEQAANDPDLFVFTNLSGVGSMEVNAFHRGCDVVIQKSLREGSGLVVSEALWKEK